MTVNELIAVLSALPADQRELPAVANDDGRWCYIFATEPVEFREETTSGVVLVTAIHVH